MVRVFGSVYEFRSPVEWHVEGQCGLSVGMEA